MKSRLSQATTTSNRKAYLVPVKMTLTGGGRDSSKCHEVTVVIYEAIGDFSVSFS